MLVTPSQPSVASIDRLIITSSMGVEDSNLASTLRRGKRSLSRAARILADLADGTKMVRQVSEARDHSRQFDGRHLTRCIQRSQPSMCFEAEATPDRLPS